MDDSPVARRTRSASKSTTAASSPAGADRRYSDSPRREKPSAGSAGKNKVIPDVGKSYPLQNNSDSKIGRNSPALGTAINEKFVPKLVTPSGPQTASGFQSCRSDGSRPPIGTVDSSSTTGSSINVNKVFDTPASSPPCDSNSTSPEEDAFSPHDNQLPVDYLRRIPPQRTDDDDQEPVGSGSPTVDRERRKKSSTKSRIAPILLIGTSRSSTNLKPPAIGRQRSSSAPTVASPTKPKPSSDNPSFSNDKYDLAFDFGKLSLGGRNDAITSPRTSRAGSRTLGKLAAEQTGRPSSASGRVERRVTNRVGKSPETSERNNSSNKDTDCGVRLDVRWSKPEKALQPSLSAQSRIAGVEELNEPNNTPKESTMQLDPSALNAVRASRPIARSILVQRQVINDYVETEDHTTPGKSSSIDNKPSEMSKDGSESGSDTESDTIYPTDADTVLAANAKPRNLEDSGAESDKESELSDPGDSESESNTSSEFIDLDDARSRSRSIPEEDALPASDGERRYPDFHNFDEEACNDKDIKDDLIDLIKKKIPKPKPGKEKGSIYVYSSPACPGFFKIGLTHSTIKKRVKKQKKCGFAISRIEDCNHRRFRYAKRVDDLIKKDLNDVRRKFTCKNHKNNSGGPMNHGEWYEMDLERLLQVIEKWRSWITLPENNPYDQDGVLIPRWEWKLDKHCANRKDLHLDHFAKPFTHWEDLMYRKDWFVGTFKDLYAQGRRFHKGVTDSTLFVVIMSTLLFLVGNLGLQAGLTCFVILATTIMIILSG
jgi:T5orf172 domain